MDALGVLVHEVPYLGAVCLFGFLMLRIQAAEGAAYREMIAGVLRDLAVAIGRVDERTEACINRGGRGGGV